MKSIFSEYTPPQALITGNGPWCTSKEFEEFGKDYNIEHIMSSPHYHEGNGLTEKYIDNVKNWLQKTKDLKQDPYKSMLIYQTTPLKNNLQPTLELHNKHAWTNLSVSNSRKSMIHGHSKDNINLQNQCKNDPIVQMKQPAPLPKGRSVMTCDMINKKWFLGTIKSQRVERNSYDITSSKDVTYRHSHQHLKPYIPRLPSLNKIENDKNEVENEVQDSETKSQHTTEARRHSTKNSAQMYWGLCIIYNDIHSITVLRSYWY